MKIFLAGSSTDAKADKARHIVGSRHVLKSYYNLGISSESREKKIIQVIDYLKKIDKAEE